MMDIGINRNDDFSPPPPAYVNYRTPDKIFLWCPLEETEEITTWNRYNPNLIETLPFIQFICNQLVHESGHVVIWEMDKTNHKIHTGYDYLQSQGIIV